MAITIRRMQKPLPPSRTAPQFVVRFPDADLRDRIKRESDGNGRSMNAQIVFMLQSYLDGLDRERYENSPESWEDMERAAREAIPLDEGVSLNAYAAEKRAAKQADLVAEKVVAKLISTDEFILKIQRALSGQSKGGF